MDITVQQVELLSDDDYIGVRLTIVRADERGTVKSGG